MRITNPYTGDVSQSSGGGGYSLWGGRKCHVHSRKDSNSISFLGWRRQ